VLRGHGDGHGDGHPFPMADVYAAADAVVLPSSWEGFGNPSVESAVHRRPLAIGRYPVARELAAYGFRWLAADDRGGFASSLDHPDPTAAAHNFAVANRHFALRDLPDRLGNVLAAAGWAPLVTYASGMGSEGAGGPALPR
jgi:mannosylglucosylglycerate synthase